jgi:hypothetical protein
MLTTKNGILPVSVGIQPDHRSYTFESALFTFFSLPGAADEDIVTLVLLSSTL